MPHSKLSQHFNHQKRHVRRLSKKSLQFFVIFVGAAIVALIAVVFAKLADIAMDVNKEMIEYCWWIPLVILPLGLPLVRWMTDHVAPYSVGSGIPQVIAALSFHRPNPARSRLINFTQAMWKIPLSLVVFLIGGSIGREGPTIQIGAALMLTWGKISNKLGLPLSNFRFEEWVAAGAAGGLAAAFNAPLAGVIFAIEEIGKGRSLIWDRLVIIGVLATGFMVVAAEGNNPYFGAFGGHAIENNMILWVMLCAVVAGLAGGFFGETLVKGYVLLTPKRFRPWVRRHPYLLAGIFGVIVALIGFYTHGLSFGTGYDVAGAGLKGQALGGNDYGVAKTFANIFTYWGAIPGGIFTPSLSAGAGFGNLLATVFHMDAYRAVFVLLCMSAFLSGVTQAPVTSAVIVMEMTGCQPMLFWLLICSLMASMISKQICPHAFYHFSGVRFFHRSFNEELEVQSKKEAEEEARKKRMELRAEKESAEEVARLAKEAESAVSTPAPASITPGA